MAILSPKIDLIRFSRSYDSILAKKKYNETLEATFSQVGGEGGLKVFNAGNETPYVRTFFLPCKGSHFGFLDLGNKDKAVRTSFLMKFSPTNKSGGAIGIEFAPSQLSEADWVKVGVMLQMLFPNGGTTVLDTFKLSKVEFATDISVPFDDLRCCIAPYVKTVDKSLLEKGTLYLGHEFGHRSFKLYDKAKQLGEKKKYRMVRPVTRIEVTLKGLGVKLDSLNTVTAPYGRLLLVRNSSLSTLKEQNPSDSVLIKFCEEVLMGETTAQELYMAMNPYTKKRISKLLRPLSFKLNADDPKKWTDWLTSEQDKLKARLQQHC